jgi:hypothetical protein
VTVGDAITLLGALVAVAAAVFALWQARSSRDAARAAEVQADAATRQADAAEAQVELLREQRDREPVGQVRASWVQESSDDAWGLLAVEAAGHHQLRDVTLELSGLDPRRVGFFGPVPWTATVCPPLEPPRRLATLDTLTPGKPCWLAVSWPRHAEGSAALLLTWSVEGRTERARLDLREPPRPPTVGIIY